MSSEKIENPVDKKTEVSKAEVSKPEKPAPSSNGILDMFNNWRRSLKLPQPGSFEQLHKEVRGVFVTNFLFDGAKLDMAKSLSQNFQISHSIALGSQVAPSQYSLTSVFVQDKTFITGTMDHEGTLQARANYALTSGLTSKFQGQYGGSRMPSMAQFEMDYSGMDFSSNVKAVNPSVVDGTGIYVASHLQSLTKKIVFGVEVAAQHPEPSVLEYQSSLVGKYSGKGFVLTANVAQFGVLQTSYYQKLNENVEVGAELQLMRSPEKLEGVCTVGGKWEFRQSAVRAQVDTTGRVCSVMEQRLAPGISFLVTADLDHLKGQSKFGVGLQMEG